MYEDFRDQNEYYKKFTVKDLNRFADTEKHIIVNQLTSETAIHLLEGFPFTTIEEIREAVTSKRIEIRADFNPEELSQFGTTMSQIYDVISSWIPIIMIPLLIWFSYHISNYYLLFGIPIIFIGLYNSSPYVKSTSITIINFILFIYFISTSIQTGYILSGTYILSLFLYLTKRNSCEIALVKTALVSPTIFIFMYEKKIITIYDMINNKFITSNHSVFSFLGKRK